MASHEISNGASARPPARASSSSDADGHGKVDPVEDTSMMVDSRRAAGHCSGVATARRSAQVYCGTLAIDSLDGPALSLFFSLIPL